MIYRIGIHCPNCCEPIISNGYCMETIYEDVVMMDAFENQDFVCHSCGAMIYTGDMSCMCEYDVPDDFTPEEEDAFEEDDEDY